MRTVTIVIDKNGVAIVELEEFQGKGIRDRTAWTRWVVKRGKNNKGRMLLVHLRRSGSSPRATQRTRMRDSRMSEGEKEGPARQRRTAHPRVVTGRPDRARGMRGLALTVPSCVLIIWITALGKSRRRTARGP